MRSLFVILFLVFSGCTSFPIQIEEYPLIEDSELTPSVLVAFPISGRYLKQFDECLGGEIVCMDPAPQAIKYNNELLVYGAKLPSSLEIATTSHYGLRMFNFDANAPELILVGSKNNRYILPRYHREPLAKLKSGDYVIPIFSSDVPYWFPCYLLEKIKPISLHEWSKYILGVKEEDADDDIRKSKYISLENGVFMPTHGISINDISGILDERSPSMQEFSCEKAT